MAALPVSDIEAVVFDLFGTLVYEFPRADWEGWLETSAAILEADVDAFKAAWQATGIERQTGRLGDLEENLRTVAARAGAWPTDAQLTEILDGRAAMYRKWFVPRPGAEEILGRLRGDGYRLALTACARQTLRRCGARRRSRGPSMSRCSRATSGSASPTPRSTCSRPSGSA
jgi:phosphoglycolate phosphatase-like HAD superfamily hydrolase